MGYSRVLGIFPYIFFLHLIITHDVSSFPEIWQRQSSETYDFIIVGAGTAGCALANRLSSSGKHSVLLLEAGGNPPEVLSVPALAPQNQLIPEITFQYQSVPQRNGVMSMSGGSVRVSLGRVLGGGSQINYGVMNRANPYDYDNWANLTGDPSWKYENMLKYFKRSEIYLGQFPSYEQHGQRGNIPVSYQAHAPGALQWLAAGRELGFQIRDSNSQQISFSPVEFSRRFGRRVSSYEGYLKPIMNSRSNLKVITNAYATRVVFEGSTAIGVRYNSDGSFSSTSPTSTVVYAKREVILSSGTFGSSVLLLKSGVGPKTVLREAKIPLVKQLPVGENLQDHPEVPMHIILNNKTLAMDPLRDLTPENFRLFQNFGIGPYTSSAASSGQAFIASSVARTEGQANWPDIHHLTASITTRMPTYRNFTLHPWETSIIAYSYLSREKSRGSVRLDPRNVDGMPLIDFNYLADKRDEQALLDAVDSTLNIFEQTQTYRQLGARFPPNPVAACDHLKFRTRGYWRCFIKETLIYGNHPAGTCSINSVVDSNFRVIGINGLRVADASVMPFITNSNLQAAVYGIAEKAADTILRAH